MKCWKVSTRIHFLLKSIMPYYFKKQIYKRNHSQQCRKVPVTWVSTVKVLMNIFTNWLNLKSQQFGISFVRSCYDLKCSEHYRMIPNADSSFSWRLLTVGCNNNFGMAPRLCNLVGLAKPWPTQNNFDKLKLGAKILRATR